MATIAGTMTTFDRTNFVGPLNSLSSDEAVFLSLIGGMAAGGGQIVNGKHFTQQTSTHGTPSQPSIAEAASPTYAELDRSEAFNVVQIHQKGIQMSWSAQSMFGELSGFTTRTWSLLNSLGVGQPVQDEFQWQLREKLIEIKRDMNYSFLRGTFQDPSDNNTGRQTRGILAATTTNVLNKAVVKGTASGTDWTFDFTGGASEDLWTSSTAHGLAVGDEVVFITDGGGAAPYDINIPYFVITAPSTTTVTLGTTKSGSALAGTSDSSGNWDVAYPTELTDAYIKELIRTMKDNISKVTTPARFRRPVMLTGSTHIQQRVDSLYGLQPASRTIGGTNVQTLITPVVGQPLNFVFDEMMEANTLLLADLSEVHPVAFPTKRFRDTQPRGVLFLEYNNDDTSSDRCQIYGEWGLHYGPENWHGQINYLATEPV